MIAKAWNGKKDRKSRSPVVQWILCFLKLENFLFFSLSLLNHKWLALTRWVWVYILKEFIVCAHWFHYVWGASCSLIACCFAALGWGWVLGRIEQILLFLIRPSESVPFVMWQPWFHLLLLAFSPFRLLKLPSESLYEPSWFISLLKTPWVGTGYYRWKTFLRWLAFNWLRQLM